MKLLLRLVNGHDPKLSALLYYSLDQCHVRSKATTGGMNCVLAAEERSIIVGLRWNWI